MRFGPWWSWVLAALLCALLMLAVGYLAAYLLIDVFGVE